jgi:hypothetical protein
MSTLKMLAAALVTVTALATAERASAQATPEDLK